MRWDALGCVGMRWDALGCFGMLWDAIGTRLLKIQVLIEVW